MHIWKIGITGGIGAGKTTVAKIFQTLNIPVYFSDDRAKQLMDTDPQIREQITRLLGVQAYDSNGMLNRSFIASKIFSESHLLKQMNAIIHPRILEDGAQWHSLQTNVPYTLKEAALLFESGSYLHLDAVINVYAPEDIRIERIRLRDRVSGKQVIDRIQNQWPDERRQMLADFEIVNDGNQLIIPQILSIHRVLKKERIRA